MSGAIVSLNSLVAIWITVREHVQRNLGAKYMPWKWHLDTAVQYEHSQVLYRFSTILLNDNLNAKAVGGCRSTKGGNQRLTSVRGHWQPRSFSLKHCHRVSFLVLLKKMQKRCKLLNFPLSPNRRPSETLSSKIHNALYRYLGTCTLHNVSPI